MDVKKGRDEETELAVALSRHHHRMIAAGIALNDFEQLREERASRWMEWYRYWTQRGDAYAALGEEAETRGRSRTADDHWLRAALCHHFAQFMLYDDAEAKSRAQKAKVELYTKATSRLAPPATLVREKSSLGEVPVVLRAPRAGRPSPCVVIVPGLEATKEEMHGWQPYFLERGLATATFDGPGQGELGEVALVPEAYVDQGVGAVLRVLERSAEVDVERVGIVGVSLGGLLASMAAARDHRFRAAAEIGGTFDTESRWERANVLSKLGHQHVTHSISEEETRKKIATWTMKPLAGAISCRFLVVHGERDNVVPLDQAIAYRDHVPDAELVVVPGGNHVCNNLAHVVRPLVADWFADALGAG